MKKQDCSCLVLVLVLILLLGSVASDESLLVGCYRDCGGEEAYGDGSRDLPHKAQDSGATVETCLQACSAQGYWFAGVQFGGECWCGNSYGRYGTAERQDDGDSDGDSGCSFPCTSNASQTCGGYCANSVYTTSPSLECFPQRTGRCRTLLDVVQNRSGYTELQYFNRLLRAVTALADGQVNLQPPSAAGSGNADDEEVKDIDTVVSEVRTAVDKGLERYRTSKEVFDLAGGNNIDWSDFAFTGAVKRFTGTVEGIEALVDLVDAFGLFGAADSEPDVVETIAGMIDQATNAILQAIEESTVALQDAFNNLKGFIREEIYRDNLHDGVSVKTAYLMELWKNTQSSRVPFGRYSGKEAHATHQSHVNAFLRECKEAVPHKIAHTLLDLVDGSTYSFSDFVAGITDSTEQGIRLQQAAMTVLLTFKNLIMLEHECRRYGELVGEHVTDQYLCDRLLEMQDWMERATDTMVKDVEKRKSFISSQPERHATIVYSRTRREYDVRSYVCPLHTSYGYVGVGGNSFVMAFPESTEISPSEYVVEIYLLRPRNQFDHYDDVALSLDGTVIVPHQPGRTYCMFGGWSVEVQHVQWMLPATAHVSKSALQWNTGTEVGIQKVSLFGDIQGSLHEIFNARGGKLIGIAYRVEYKHGSGLDSYNLNCGADSIHAKRVEVPKRVMEQIQRSLPYVIKLPTQATLANLRELQACTNTFDGYATSFGSIDVFDVCVDRATDHPKLSNADYTSGPTPEPTTSSFAPSSSPDDFNPTIPTSEPSSSPRDTSSMSEPASPPDNDIAISGPTSEPVSAKDISSSVRVSFAVAIPVMSAGLLVLFLTRAPL